MSKKKIEVSHNPDTGLVFIKNIEGNVTAEEIDQAKLDYYAKAKKLAVERRKAAQAFDAQYLTKRS